MNYYIGLMSGTSMDGIDAALVSQPENTLVCGLMRAYSLDVKERILDLAHNVSLAKLCQLNTLIGREFALAVNDLLQKSKIGPQEIRAIGSHGQTVCHEPRSTIPYTLQLGCGHTISALTGIRVIADFRTKDLVNGGQGAPFAPVYHQELFSGTDENLAVVNIGGIANVTLINPHKPPQGWDTGPGNCLMDAWIKKHQDKDYDVNGLWARQGKVNQDLLQKLLADPFFSLAEPKSIGKEYFSLSWLESYLWKEYQLADIQATLLALTAHSIAAPLLTNQDIKTVYLCGGGTHNQFLVEYISNLLTKLKVKNIADAGFNPDYIEAMMFSWFAFKTLNESPIDLSSVTGSRGPTILGALYK